MSKKDFRLVRPVKDAYSTREVGYEDTFDYPNLYNEKTGEVGICGGHGIYAWAKREDYELINQTKMSKEEPYMTFMTNEEIVKHIEHLKTLDLPELEKQGMISDWEKSLNQNKDK